MKHPSILSLMGKKIISYNDKMIKEWHEKLPTEETVLSSLDLLTPIRKNCFYNFSLWHTEDEARRKDVTDSVIADIKRKIDGFNQKRNNAMEEIDAAYVHALLKIKKYKDDKRLNSETPGSIYDRLCIMSLRVYHMIEQTLRKDASPEHIISCQSKLSTLKIQRQNLGTSLDDLILEYKSGKKSLKVYFQFKMYNDPLMNPAVYGHRKK